MIQVFAASDYKDLMRAHLHSHKEERGYQAKMAKAAGCGSSFLSQVLNTHVHLTPDQAAGIGQFWGLSPDKMEFFLCLVQLARTVAPAYKNYLLEKIQHLRAKNSDISHRVESEAISKPEEELLYYSAWYWSAIHVLTSIPGFQTSTAISQRLGLPTSKIENCLAKLEEMGMVSGEKGKWQALNKSYHLASGSPLIGIHHSNWRNYCLQDLSKDKKDSLHYSVVHSLSEKDFELLKEMILTFISQSKKIVANSPEQEIVGIGIDCYRL